MTPMCQRDHRIKSAAERRVWAFSRRFEDRLSIFHHRPGPWLSFFGVLFVAGMLTTYWVPFSLIALALLWFAPPMFRQYRPKFTGRSMGGGGFNRLPDFQRILEMRQPGVEGQISRTYWLARRRAFIARYSSSRSERSSAYIKTGR